jgi:hypothetical protein
MKGHRGEPYQMPVMDSAAVIVPITKDAFL